MDKSYVEPVIPLHIRIGVTGHRTLPDEKILTDLVRQILTKRFLEAFDAKAQKEIKEVQITFTVISPLAEGADRLVARAVMEFPGSRLEAVLPFSREEYEKDFTTPESQKEFMLLLENAQCYIELEKEITEGITEKVSKKMHQCGYRKAGEYVVEHSDILIALWDGKPARGKEGTAEIVSLAINWGKPIFIISTNPPYNVRIKNGDKLQVSNLTKINSFVTDKIP